jgi:hypothetical protein
VGDLLGYLDPADQHDKVIKDYLCWSHRGQAKVNLMKVSITKEQI